MSFCTLHVRALSMIWTQATQAFLSWRIVLVQQGSVATDWLHSALTWYNTKWMAWQYCILTEDRKHSSTLHLQSTYYFIYTSQSILTAIWAHIEYEEICKQPSFIPVHVVGPIFPPQPSLHIGGPRIRFRNRPWSLIWLQMQDHLVIGSLRPICYVTPP